MLRPLPENEERFAFFLWKERWNNQPAVASATVVESDVYLQTTMGIVIINLEEWESVEVFVKHMTEAFVLLRNVKRKYDNTK